MHLNNSSRAHYSSHHLFFVFVLSLFTFVAFSAAEDVPTTNVPTTQPGLDYKPGVDQVMKLLRDPSSLESAKRIIRGFPEDALPIVKDGLAHQFHDLPADVRLDVARIVDRNHAARAHARELDDAALKWNEDAIRDNYQKAGLRDPSWDNDAIAAMISFVRNKPDTDLFQKAQDEGCNDPLFRYCYARALQNISGARYTRRMDEAADAMMASNYPVSRKCFALLNAVKADFPAIKSQTPLTGVQLKRIQKRLDTALTLYPQACKELNMAPQLLAELAELLQDGYFRSSGDRLKAIDTVYPVVAGALPHSTIPLDFKGKVYVNLAWDARGNGWSDTITPEGADLMRQRLQIAREALTVASDEDSFDFAAPTQMLNVLLEDGSGQPEMERWFIKATEANPDHRPAYGHRMYYLEPKWNGSPEAMLDFGRECVATQNFAAGIPLELASAHEALSRYYGGRYSAKPQRQYFMENPSSWDDICSGFVPALYLDPDNYHNRSLFARYAVWCGQYDEAKRQFTLLADHADLQVFGNQLQFQKLRNEANGASASTQP